MRINPEKRIKEITKELNRVTKLLYSGNRYTIKRHNKKNTKRKSMESIIQTLNGQAIFLRKQKEIIAKERWRRRTLLRELRMVYRYVEKLKGGCYG